MAQNSIQQNPQGTGGLSRRTFFGGLLVGAAGVIVNGAFAKFGEDTYERSVIFIKDLIQGNIRGNNTKEELWFLFGDRNKPTGILPGNLNRHLLSQGDFRTSRFNSSAFKSATKLYTTFFSPTSISSSDSLDPRLSADKFAQLLIIGGPIESDATCILEGYKTIVTSSNPDKPMPVTADVALLPYSFYCGNEQGWGYWGDEFRTAARWKEDNSEGNFPLYGIKNTKTGDVYAPVIEDNRLASDMLSITRLPNPNDPSGSYTIVSGMHGYSFDVFFKDPIKNSNLFKEFFRLQQNSFFQALVPVRLNRDHTATIEWKGMGANWLPRFELIDPSEYLLKVKKIYDKSNVIHSMNA